MRCGCGHRHPPTPIVALAWISTCGVPGVPITAPIVKTCEPKGERLGGVHESSGGSLGPPACRVWALLPETRTHTTTHLAHSDRMPLRGALSALRFGLSCGEYRFTLKYLACLSLLPFTGREKFTTLSFDVSFSKAIRTYFSRYRVP